MPELPEVETVVRGLRNLIVGYTFERVVTQAPKSSITISKTFRHKKRKLENILPGRVVTSIDRRGKNILISLSGDITLWIHLKMTGKLLCLRKQTPVSRHDLVIFEFTTNTSDKKRHIRFNDYRRFGRIRLYPNHELWEQPGLADLGPEPLEMKSDLFVQICKQCRRMIKPALLDQTFIAGIGNIYADETLYLARIHPQRLTNSISSKKLTELHGYIQKLLKKSISLMGTTVDSYAGVNGKPGSFQKYLQVYSREGESCNRCGSSIKRYKIASRSAHICPQCQRLR